MKQASADQSLGDFCSQLAAGTPAPGGGAAAAASGAIGAALVAMVAGLTVGRPKHEAVQEEMLALQEAGQREVEALLLLSDRDQVAFNEVMAAFALPKEGAAEKESRQQAIQSAFQQATAVPLETMRHTLTVMRYALAAASRGNPNALSDAFTGYFIARAAFDGGRWNVAINLASLKQSRFKTEVVAAVSRLDKERQGVIAAFERLVPDLLRPFLGES